MTTINEKRRFKRFPVLYHLVKPVLIKTGNMSNETALPAIMANLSAGGMALFTFAPLAIGQKLLISFVLRDLKIENIEAKIVRCENKEGSYVIGFQFLNITKEIDNKLRRMADDFDACQMRIVLGDKSACKKDCGYFDHCQKPIKKTF
ncbi:MAG: PilZ domain-containing protein [Elusimicrobia bacterium]|nr:PilZ domain-containing protein [Elusimicrobiota bacterium]